MVSLGGVSIEKVIHVTSSKGGVPDYVRFLTRDRHSWEPGCLLCPFLKKADIIHIHHEYLLYGKLISFFFPELIKLLRRKGRVVTTLHGVINLNIVTKDFLTSNRLNVPPFLAKVILKRITRGIVKNSDKVIVHADYFKNILVDQYSCDEGKIEVIPHLIPDINPNTKPKFPQNRIGLFGFRTGYKDFSMVYKVLPKEKVIHKWIPFDKFDEFFNSVDFLIFPYT